MLKQKLPEEKDVHFIDIGCGPGTASLAWCLSLEENDLPDSLTLVDKSKEMLKVAERIFSVFFQQ